MDDTYTVDEIFERAEEDASWEDDPEMRARIVAALKSFLYGL